MNDISPELNQAPLKKDNKSVKSRLKKVAGKVIMGTPLAGLILSSGIVDNPNVPVLNIKEPIPVSAPSNFVFSELGREPYTGIIARPDVDLAVTTKLKEAGIERILVDKDSRMPTNEELEEIGSALSLAPYCTMLAPQLHFTDREIFSKNSAKSYGGNSNLPRTIKIIIPSEASYLDEPVQDDKAALTNRERLRKIVLHECGHKIDTLIFDYFNSKNLKKGNKPYEHYDLEDGSRLSQDLHPFYRAFAKMKGLSLVRGSWNNIYFVGKEYEILDERFDEYHTENIDEYLAELFAISRLKPEMLTDKERSFLIDSIMGSC